VYRGAASAELKADALAAAIVLSGKRADPVESASQLRCTPGWPRTCLLP
jgi:hypothetical protein